MLEWATDQQIRGVDAIEMENTEYRITLLPGKGGDVIELRDKTIDRNILFEAPHNWQVPGSGYVQSKDTGTAWMDHYPGGWQDCLPMGGNDPKAAGAVYGIHGESSLIPWNYDVSATAEAVTATLSTELVRYPFYVERRIRVPKNQSVIHVEATIENRGTVELPYIWLQHIAWGAPLVSSGSTIDMPNEAQVTVDAEPQGDSPLTPGDEFAWSTQGTDSDLSTMPAGDSGIHDLSYIHGFDDGWYAITNPELERGVAVSFDADLFESVWCWRALGGFEMSPFFGRETVVGLEPCTGYPAGDLPDAQGPDGTGTLKTIGAGETVSTSLSIALYSRTDRVSSFEEVAERPK